ncbi:MAG: Flp pilus assembly protein CpaB [Anaerolineae bacterium]|jgi:Flp pilus assembly protein CpaB
MKRRSLLWFVASALLALLAGVLAVVFLQGTEPSDGTPVPEQLVVVARSPIAENEVIRVDYVSLEARTEFPSGAAVEVQDVVGGTALRDIVQGEVVLMQDIRIITGTSDLPFLLGDDTIAVALVADDVLSKWGAVMPGDHVDVLFTLDVILEKPMYIDDIRTVEEAQLYSQIERDQSLDNVSVLTLQNLEVLQIIEEPQVGEEQAQQQEEAPQLPQRALILKVDPQDAVVLKYLRDTIGSVDLALRSPDNEALFNVQPVNINYLMLRYGIVLPQPLE